MSKIISDIYKKSMESYTYSDCDGDNNRGVRLNEKKFATNVIREVIKLNMQFVGHRINDDLQAAYEDHFGIKL